MTYPGILFWIFTIWAMSSRGPALYYLFFLCWSLGTLAVIPPQLAGGNFTPAWIVAVFLTIKIILEVGPARYLEAMVDLKRFGALSLCTLYSVLSAFLLPRLFEGQVDVVEMRLIKTGDPVPLEPNGANFTQTMYFVFTTLIIVDVYFVCRDPAKRKQFLTAFAWGAVFAAVTGLMDLVASKAGLSGLLAPFRNAAYVLMLDSDAMDMHRIVGLMSEASSFASLCLPFLALIALTPPEAGAPWKKWSTALALLLTVMTYLSTSSSGYVSLGVVALVWVFNIAMGMAMRRRWAWLGCYVILIAVTVGVAVLLFAPQVSASLYRVMDGMVLHKTQSESYIQRSAWNRTAYQAFLGTHGLGAGTGAARASSWPIALLANIGVPGTGLLLTFMAQAFLARPKDPADRALARAAKLALVPNLVMASLSGTSISLGIGVSMLFGLICALAWTEQRRVAGPVTTYLHPEGAQPS